LQRYFVVTAYNKASQTGLQSYEQAGNFARLLCPWVLFVQRQTVIRFNGPTKSA